MFAAIIWLRCFSKLVSHQSALPRHPGRTPDGNLNRSSLSNQINRRFQAPDPRMLVMLIHFGTPVMAIQISLLRRLNLISFLVCRLWQISCGFCWRFNQVRLRSGARGDPIITDYWFLRRFIWPWTTCCCLYVTCVIVSILSDWESMSSNVHT